MKRYVMSAAVAVMFLLGGTTISNAQVPEQEPQEQTQSQQQDEFEKVDEDDVPDAIKKAVDKQFEESEMGDVSKNDDDIYKVELKPKEGMGETQEVLFNKDGEQVEQGGM